MAFCQPIAALTLPAISVGHGYFLEPRIFSLATNVVSVSVFSFLLYRLSLGYRLALSGGYAEYHAHPLALTKASLDAAASPLNRPILASSSSSSTTSAPRRSSPPSSLSFPLVFPLYYRFLLLLLALLLCQLLLSLFVPNSPVSGPFVFYPSISVYVLFHAAEQGLLVFLCQRSIGAGAIRRSLTYAGLWGVIALASVLLAVSADQHEQNSGGGGGGNSTSARPPSGQVVHRGVRRSLLSAGGGGAYQLAGEEGDWESGSWMDVSGSVVIIDTDTRDFHWVYLSCALCDAVLLLHYAALAILRMRCTRAMPWLSSRVAAFGLARFLFLRRLLSLLSILIFVLTSAHPYTFCFNIAVQLYMLAYPLSFYLLLVWDSRFWRTLESLANGPYPAYRSLDDNGRRKSEAKPTPPAGDRTPTSSPSSTPSSSPSSSIAPLLKLPRQGLANLDPILSHLVDFSELSIDSSHPLAVGQEHTAVYAALYRGEAVAVKRLRCDVLTIELIERELNEARLMSEMSHRHVVRFIGVCIRPPSICLVSELCEGGSLSQWIRDRRREMEEEARERWRVERRARRNGAGEGVHTPPSEEAKEGVDPSPPPSRTSSSTSPVAYPSSHASPSIDLPPSFPLSTVLSWSLDACCALLYLHSSSPPIVHRDIKSSNFVLSPSPSYTPFSSSSSSPPYLMKVLDFGESRRFHWADARGEKRRDEKGTLSWMAPELMRDWRVAQHVREVMGVEGVKKERLNDEELNRLLGSVGMGDEAGVEAWRETKEDEEAEWEEIIQATSSISSAAASQAATSASSPTSALSPLAAPQQSTSFTSSSSSSSRFSSSASSSPSFLSRSFFASASRYGSGVDLYGLSMLMWCMLSLQPHPFVSIPSFLVPFLVSKGVRPRCPPHTPPLLVKLVRSGWHPDARKRPTAAQMMDRLECVQFQLAGAEQERVLREQQERRMQSRSSARSERSSSGSVTREGVGISVYTPPSATRRRDSGQRTPLTSFGLPPLITQPSSSFPSEAFHGGGGAEGGLPAFVSSSSSAPLEGGLRVGSGAFSALSPSSRSPLSLPRGLEDRGSVGMRTIAQGRDEEEDEDEEEVVQSGREGEPPAHSEWGDDDESKRVGPPPLVVDNKHPT